MSTALGNLGASSHVMHTHKQPSKRTFGAEKKSNLQTHSVSLAKWCSLQQALPRSALRISFRSLMRNFSMNASHSGTAPLDKERAFSSVFVLPVRAQRTNPLPSPQQESGANRKPTLVTVLCSFSTSLASKPLKSRRLIYCPC